jgi:hypothetical protein
MPRRNILKGAFAGSTINVQLSEGVTSCNVSDNVKAFLEAQARELTFLSFGPSIPESRYLIMGTSMHQAWRLYEDNLFSSVSAGMLSDGGDEFR